MIYKKALIQSLDPVQCKIALYYQNADETVPSPYEPHLVQYMRKKVPQGIIVTPATTTSTSTTSSNNNIEKYTERAIPIHENLIIIIDDNNNNTNNNNRYYILWTVDSGLYEFILHLEKCIDNYKTIIMDVNSVLCETNRWTIPFHIVNKPVQLKRTHNISQDYVALLKTNGTRFLMVVHEHDHLLINFTKLKLVTPLQTSWQPPPVPNKVSLLDVEYCPYYITNIQERILAFDCLVFNGVDVRYTNYPMRYNHLVNFHSILTVQRCFTDRSQIPVHHVMDDMVNDGLVFTPIYAYYNNAQRYKWKPLNSLTVDLQTSDDRTQLLTSDKVVIDTNASMVFHPGINEYHCDNDGTIWFTRTRHDKKYANSYRVVKDVMAELNNPIPLAEILVEDKFKNIQCIEKMIPRDNCSSSFYTRKNTLDNIVRTGLFDTHSIDQQLPAQYFRGIIMGLSGCNDPMDLKICHDKILKTLRGELNMEKMVMQSSPSYYDDFVAFIEKYSYDTTSAGLQFILDKIVSVDKMQSLVPKPNTGDQPLGLMTTQWTEACMDEFDEHTGFSSQRVKIETLKTILQKLLSEISTQFIQQCMDKIKNNPVHTFGDIDDVHRVMDFGCIVIDDESGKIVHHSGKQHKRCVLLIQFLPTRFNNTSQPISKTPVVEMLSLNIDGTPERIFTVDQVRDLFKINNDSSDNIDD